MRKYGSKLRTSEPRLTYTGYYKNSLHPAIIISMNEGRVNESCKLSGCAITNICTCFLVEPWGMVDSLHPLIFCRSFPQNLNISPLGQHSDQTSADPFLLLTAFSDFPIYSRAWTHIHRSPCPMYMGKSENAVSGL